MASEQTMMAITTSTTDNNDNSGMSCGEFDAQVSGAIEAEAEDAMAMEEAMTMIAAGDLNDFSDNDNAKADDEGCAPLLGATTTATTTTTTTATTELPPPLPGIRHPPEEASDDEDIPIAMNYNKNKATYYAVSFAIMLSGFAGVIAHSISFSTQTSIITNTYKTAWFAAVFALSGLNLLQLLTKPRFSQKSFWFELVVIVLLGCSSFISLVCLGYSQDWKSFAWVFVTYISVAASAIYLLQCKNVSVPDENQTRTATVKVITAGIYLLKVLFMLIVSLLASGSILSAKASSYPPTGWSISVLFDGANRNGTLQMYCIGNSNISKPTIFIFTSSAHGIVDLYGLQYFLSTTNGTSRRVCIHDPLGFGWSQDPFDGQFTNYEYLYRLMLSSNESMPWHIVGWGGGGSANMYLANKHTSSIKSVTFVETYPPGIEFSFYGYQNGLSQQAISEYRNAQLSSRIGLVKLILSMAIPWGLMGIFVPISPQHEGYYPPERWSEFRVQMWKSKVWISQYQGLRHLQMTSDSQDPLISFAPISSQIPVFGVYCNATEACEGQEHNEQECTQLTYYNSRKFSMIREISTNATIAVNSDVDCNLNLPVEKPLFTASSILKLYSGIEE